MKNALCFTDNKSKSNTFAVTFESAWNTDKAWTASTIQLCPLAIDEIKRSQQPGSKSFFKYTWKKVKSEIRESVKGFRQIGMKRALGCCM